MPNQRNRNRGHRDRPKGSRSQSLQADSMVIGLPWAKVEISVDEVEALEADARRAFEEGYCDFCTQFLSGQDIHAIRKMGDGAKVLVVLSPKTTPDWSPQISYTRLEFSENDKQVQRPPFSSAFPAALVPVDAERATSLCFRVAAFPPSRTVLTVGIALWPGFKVYFGKGFGVEEESWGLQWSGEDGSPVDPGACRLRLSKGDLVCITCDPWEGSSSIALNGRQVAMFSIPCGKAFVLGATLSSGCILRIESP